MEWKDIKNIRGLRSVTLIGSSNIIGSAITSVFWISIASLIGADSYGELSYFLAIIAVIFSFIFSYLTIALFFNFIKKFSLNIFIIYRIILSLFILAIVYL